MVSLTKTLLFVIGVSAISLSALEIRQAELRHDQYPLEKYEHLWVEGWGWQDQFYPKYYKTSDTLQLELFNDSDEAITIDDFKLNGNPISEITTRADYAGFVIWSQLVPETIPAKSNAMYTVRLRDQLSEPLKLELNGVTHTVNPDDNEKITINFVTLKDGMLYIYATGDDIKGAKINGEQFDCKIYNSSCENGSPALLIGKLPEGVTSGDRPVITVESKTSKSFEQPLIKDAMYPRGIIGSGKIALYKKAGFNFLYAMHGGKFRQPIEGLTILNPVNNEADLKKVAESRPEYVLGNTDEPDAHEPAGLPYMERCGVNATQRVVPLNTLQKRFAPRNATAVMIDRTYAPLNWYTYGQITDMPFNDCYTPTRFHGFDLGVIAKTASVFLSATAPRPAQLMLYATINTNHTPRANLPHENEVSVLYTIGSGLKGVHYFLDWSSFPNISEGGYFVGATSITQLYRAMARGNALVDRLENLLMTACVWEKPKSSNPQLWSSMLLANPDTMVLTVVNNLHIVDQIDKMNFLHTEPVDKAEVTFELPEWFESKGFCSWFNKEKLTVTLVKYDGTEVVDFKQCGRTITIPMENVVIGGVYVISRVENDLNGNAEVQASVKEMQIVPTNPTGKTIEAFENDNIIKKLEVMDFSKPETIKLASKLTLQNATLEQTPTGIALLPGKEDVEAQAEILFVFETKEPISIRMHGISHNLGYLSMIELVNGKTMRTLKTTKASTWHNGRANGKEYLDVEIPPVDGKAYLKVNLRDPLLVHPDTYSMELTKLSPPPAPKTAAPAKK